MAVNYNQMPAMSKVGNSQKRQEKSLLRKHENPGRKPKLFQEEDRNRDKYEGANEKVQEIHRKNTPFWKHLKKVKYPDTHCSKTSCG